MAKKIEEKYKELSEVEHILQRPGMWVGSTKEENRDMYLFNSRTGKMENVETSFVPAMLKVVDEVISNSCDEYRRKDNMGLTSLSVTIHQSKNLIIIRDNGGIPIVKHKDAGVYVPEFIFGRLRTSSNYDDTEDRNVIGTNGVGSALCNVFSTYFEIESADGKNKFHRSWKNNMQLNEDLSIEPTKEHFTQTSFKLDLSRFGLKEIPIDFIKIIQKRCIDAAAANPGLKVSFNTDVSVSNISITFANMDQYVDLYSDYLNTKDKIAYSNKLCTAYIFPDSSVDLAFVNGAECSKGTHIRALRNDINNTIVDYLVAKDKLKELTTRGVDGRYSIFMNINVSNPSYDSQTKETLTTPIELFSKDPNIRWQSSEKFLKDLIRPGSEIVELVRDWYKKKMAAEDEKTLRKLNKEAKNGLKRPDKYVPANSKKKINRELWIYEGDSAATGFRAARDPETQGCYKMRGVPLNCLDMTPVQIMKNEVFNDIISVLGLQFGKEFDIDNLNYGHITIATDADVDGDKIAALLLLFFNNWPQLFEHHIVRRVIAPIIIATKGKDERKYYTMDEFRADEKKLKGFQIKYTKGLGGQNAKQYKDMMQNPIYMYFERDANSDSMFNRWFGKDSDQRKSLMEV